MLRDELGTRFTSYPYYFGDVLETRAGITGQYWQRMREVFVSAYLRTLAHGVNNWGLPEEIAESYCVDSVDAINGLFDVEPGRRPALLSNIPERFCEPDANFATLIHELVEVMRIDEMRLVSLDTPIARATQKYAKLTLTAHLVTHDYGLPDGGMLFEKMPPLSVIDTFALQGPPPEITIDEAKTEGKGGDEVAVCSCLFPMPFGCLQGDYFNVGMAIPASYVALGVHLKCTNESIDLLTSTGMRVARTQIWNDDWVPNYPKEGSPRCGMAAVIDESVLTAAKERLGRKLGYFVTLRVWDRVEEYGEYSMKTRSAFVV